MFITWLVSKLLEPVRVARLNSLESNQSVGRAALHLSKVRINNDSTNSIRRKRKLKGTFQSWLSVQHQASFSAKVVVSLSVKQCFGLLDLSFLLNGNTHGEYTDYKVDMLST